MNLRAWAGGLVIAAVALAAGEPAANSPPEFGKAFTLADPPVDLVWIAPGEFMLGSPDSENSRGTDEGPQTLVKITQGFWIGRTEITQAQWRAVMGNNPSRFKGSMLPVEQVSWREAMEFCEHVTASERSAGRLPAGYRYALPTEAQWEYAAKAGQGGAFAAKVDDLAWHDQNSGTTTHPVALKQPNAWGLYDMLGNVWEWCSDWYAPYPGGRATDYAGPPTGFAKSSRGGSWWAGPRGARPANRYRDMPQNGNDDLGFRLALVPDATLRIVRHAMGETIVPARAARVVTLTYESTESALALGLVPVGAVGRRLEQDFLPQVAAALTTTRRVGDEDAPDLDAIAALHPELILGVKLRHAALYPRLSEIAPTVFSETLRGEWRANFRVWASALGREPEAAAVYADWNRRIAAARLRLPEAARTPVAVLRFMPAMLRIYHERSFAMSILSEIGFPRCDFRAGNDFFEELPLARLAELNNCRAVFWFVWEDGDGRALQRARDVTAGVAWNSLPAVRARQSFRVDDGIWNTGGSFVSARLLLDDLLRCLGSASPAPT